MIEPIASSVFWSREGINWRKAFCIYIYAPERDVEVESTWIADFVLFNGIREQRCRSHGATSLQALQFAVKGALQAEYYFLLDTEEELYMSQAENAPMTQAELHELANSLLHGWRAIANW